MDLLSRYTVLVATILEVKGRNGSRYRAQVRLKGFPRQSATFSRKTDARRWASRMENELREGRYFKTAQAKKHTLSESVDRYLREVNPLRPRSMRDRQRHLEWWSAEIGHLTLADLTPVLVSEFREKLASETTVRGEKRSPATVNRYLASIAHLFTTAVRDWGWAEDNPCRRVARRKEPRGRVRFLSEEERARLLAACKASSDPRLYPLVLLGLSTGARAGELLRLRWAAVDLQREVAVLHETKNDDRRALPLSGLALVLLRDLRRVRRLDSDLVFAARDGRAVFPRWAWEKAVLAARLQDFRFHDLRHSAASYLAMSGATLAEIAEVLGHKTLAMVRRYSHLSSDHVAKVVATMNAKYLGQSEDDVASDG